MREKRMFLMIKLVIFMCFIFVVTSANSEGIMDKWVENLDRKSEDAKIKIVKADITSNLDTPLRLYKIDNGFFPTTEQGLLALIEKPMIPPIPPNWDGPYIERSPTDVWGNPYVYVCPGVHNLDSFDLSSVGPDGVESEDDITNWE